MDYKIKYSVYPYPLSKYPLANYSSINDAIADLTNCDDASVIVEVVHEVFENGETKILEERIHTAPQVWFENRFKPNFDGVFVTAIKVKEICGNITDKLSVTKYSYGKWILNENETIHRWMKVDYPQ
jgi:hypothetical protein